MFGPIWARPNSASGTCRSPAAPESCSNSSTAWATPVDPDDPAFAPEDRFPSPSLLATGYYNATSAALQCLDQVNGDLSDGQAAFRSCLSTLELDAPNGKISLDGNRQAIGTNFVSEVVQLDDGNLATQLVAIKENVNQTLGIDPDVFAQIGLPSRDVPECKSSYE